MGELIKRESPREALTFTGERFTSENSGQTAIEHLHRALMARSLCREKDVLDIASGEGYGSALFSQVARSVVGVDVSPEAVAHAQTAYGRDNLEFRQGSAHAIPLDDDSVDVVVSFETIEHFGNQSRFLEEVRRVLRPGGLAIVSTPDLAHYSVDGEPPNPHHVEEMTRDEFGALMARHFEHLLFLGQRTLVGSALVVDRYLTGKSVDAPLLTYEERSWNAFERSAGLSRARYLVALASDDPSALAAAEQSVYIATTEIDKAVGQTERLREELGQVRAELQTSRASEDRWRNDIETVTGWYRSAQQEAEAGTAVLQRAQASQEALRAELASTQAQATHFETERVRLESQHIALIDQFAEAEQRRLAAEALTQERGTQVEEACSEIAEIRAEYARLEAERVRLESEIAELAKRCADMERDRLDIEALAEQRGTEVETARHEATTARQQLAQMERDLIELRAALGRVDEIAEANQARYETEHEALTKRFRQQEIDLALLARMLKPAATDGGIFRRLVESGKAAEARNDGIASETFFRLAALACPADAGAWRHYGASLNRVGAYEAALGAWKKAIAVNQNDAAALHGLGNALSGLGRQAEAVSSWKAAFAIDPGLSGLSAELEAAGIDSTEMADIVLSSRRTRGSGRKDPIANRALHFWKLRQARRFAAQGQPRRAAAIYREMAAQSEDSTKLIRYGDAISALLGPIAARDAYLKAYAITPDDQRARRRAIDVKYHACGFIVRPKVDLEVAPENAYVTLSDDAQFDLDPDGRAFPAGWTLITIAAEASQRAIRPVLYAFHGKNGRGVTAFTFPPIVGKGDVQCLLPLPEHITSLRLDPSGESNVTFRLNRVSWSNGGALETGLFEPAPPGLAFVGEEPGMTAGSARSPRTAVLEAQHDLHPLGDEWFLSAGADPQFNVSCAGASLGGWTWIELEINGLDSPLDPTLYAWTENEVVTVRLPDFVRPGVLRALVRLPASVSQLRFDPVAREGVRFGRVTLRYCPMDTLTDDVMTPCLTVPSFGDANLGPRDASSLERIYTLKPGHQIEPAEEGSFKTTGDAARFEVTTNASGFPSGLVRLTLQIDHASQAIDAILYAADTNEVSYAYRLADIEPGRRYEFSVVLPDNVLSLQLAPGEFRNVTLATPRIELTPIDGSDGATYTVGNIQGVPSNEDGDALVADLRPLHDLDMQDGLFKSTGNDPQFGVSFGGRPLPRGWTVVTIEMNVRDAVARPVLYLWTGETVSSMPLGPISGNGRIQQLVHLPDELTAIRFDPMDVPDIHFAAPKLSFSPASLFAGHILLRQAGDARRMGYETWCDRYDRIGPADRALILESIERLAEKPLISVVMPVYNPQPRFLRRALDTVREQLYPHWELCVAEDCSPNEEIREILREYAARDERIKVVFRGENGHISRASNSALDLVTGPFIALMDHDDELPPHALYMVAHELNRFPDADIIYTDEDKVDAAGRRHDPYFKTDWNQELFYSQNFVAHLGVYRTALVREIGGFRAGFEGSQDYDFVLRLLPLTSAERIRHIPHVLYHWRIFEGGSTFSTDNPSRSVDTARRAMDEYFAQAEPDSEVVPIEAFPSWWRIKRPLPAEAPLVSIIIPTRDRIELVRNCIDGILNRTDYPNLEIILVDNGSIEAESLEYFIAISKDDRVSVVRDDGPFNYSRLNNNAVARAAGEYICFLNNDIETIARDWLSEMVSQATRAGVGAVGTRLLYADGTLQHAGVTLGVYGVAAHGHRHFPGNSIGYFGHPQLVREVSAVTAAALLMPKALFDEIGGFDEANLAVSYNDVDLCLRIGKAGHRVVYTPFAALYHLESATRGPDISPEKKELQRIERGYMIARWGDLLQTDPQYSPNLSLATEDYQIAFAPRAGRPWLEEADVAERLAWLGRQVLPAVASAGLSALAADTVIVIAAAAPFDTLAALSRDLAGGALAPAGLVLVDNVARKDGFIRQGRAAAFRESHPDVPLQIIDDPTQDFNASRTANIGLAATGDDCRHVILITEDCTFTQGWFESMLRSWLAVDEPNALISPRLFVREGSARDGVLTDGFVEIATRQVAVNPSDLRKMGDGYENLPLPDRRAPLDVPAEQSLEQTDLLPSGIVMARRELLVDGFDKAVGADTLDPLFLTQAARFEDLAWRLQSKGGKIFASLAPLAILSSSRPRDIVHLWQYWHDYLWLNRKVHGLANDQTIEFVCPFHRGDVLVGLQVANTAVAAGRSIRFHVAESLLEWVKGFAPPFPVSGLPVIIPPAHETALYLLRSYEYLMKQPDTGPRLARSHPARGLDAMNNNLARAMLASVGLPPDTPLENLAPEVSQDQEREAAAMLASFGKRVILLHCAGGWGLKSLPGPILVDFAAIVKAEGFRLVQIGGPGETPCGEVEGIIAGNFAPGLWAALFQQASAVAGIDSWTAHMASLLDVPQITFYGSTHPDHVASKQYFREKKAAALQIAPVMSCSPCNSLTCLVQPLPFCPGFSVDESRITNFLRDLAAEPVSKQLEAQPRN